MYACISHVVLILLIAEAANSVFMLHVPDEFSVYATTWPTGNVSLFNYITILIFSCKLTVTARGQSSRGTGPDRIVDINRLTEVPAKDNHSCP